MDVHEIRRRRLRELIDTRYDGVAAEFARAVGRGDAQIGNILNRHKNLGERLARYFERQVKLPKGWLDVAESPDNPPAVREEPPAYGDSPYAPLIARRAGQLDEALQLTILNLIETILASHNEHANRR
jgi:hypothetical protein